MGRLVASVLILLLAPLATGQAYESDPAGDVAPEDAHAPFVDILNVTMTAEPAGLRFVMQLNHTGPMPTDHVLTFLWVYTLDFDGGSLYAKNNGTIVCTLDGRLACRDTQEKAIVTEAGENGTHIWAVLDVNPTTSPDVWRLAGGATAHQNGTAIAQDFTSSALPGQSRPEGAVEAGTDVPTKEPWLEQGWIFVAVVLGLLALVWFKAKR